MCNLETIKTSKNVLVLNDQQLEKIQGGGDPPPWPEDDPSAG
jgi:hypothetical protein